MTREEPVQVSIPPNVYSRRAGERFVLLNMLNLRTLVLDEASSHLWKDLEARPDLKASIQDLLPSSAYPGKAAESAMQRIQQLAEARFLEIKESP